MKTFTVQEDINLKDFTDVVYPQGSFCLSTLLRNRDVKINGARTGCNAPLKRGDEVTYYTSAKQEAMPSHYAVYEDGNVLIADKLSGVSSEGLLNELREKGEFFAVHRLDRNTQGLIVFAKNERAEEELSAAFKEKKVTKTYLALCGNCFNKRSDKLCAYLVKDEKNSLVRIYNSYKKDAAEIVTEYSVKEVRGDIALVEIILHTGRTHQIRAHLAFIGCPVLGDEKYGDRNLNKKYAARRQKLISKTLRFNLNGNLSYLNERTFVSRFDFSYYN